jgi:hypothetical protein
VVCGASPPLSARMIDSMPVRKRPVKTHPTPPGRDVQEKQAQERTTEADFLADLDRASTNRSEEELERASRPDPGRSRT